MINVGHDTRHSFPISNRIVSVFNFCLLIINHLRVCRSFQISSAADERTSSIPSPSTSGTLSKASLSPTISVRSPIKSDRLKHHRDSGSHVFKADVPGLKKEEVKVEVEDDRVLQISGERNKESEDKGDTWHRVERSSGKFVRRFRLPENAKVEEVKAAMENGVLTVTVPKVEVKKPDVKSIQISG
ncbi:hypothetical protein R6Q57_027399 [Mikania cordata]